MRIAISASGKDANAQLDPRFGRCAFFAIYDNEKKEWSFLPNRGSIEGSGAGIKAAQSLLEQNVDVILTGNLGPNASRIIGASGTKVYALPAVTLEEALKLYEEGKGRPIAGATVDAHSGLGFPGGAVQEAPAQDAAAQAEPALPQTKFAVATEGGFVSQHFGRCPAYTIVEVKGNNVVDKTVIANPGHQPGFLPVFLAEKGVKCIIAGGMGPRAADLFAAQGIDTVVGIVGSVDEAIESYLARTLVGGDSLCDGQGGGGGQCDDHGEHNH